MKLVYVIFDTIQLIDYATIDPNVDHEDRALLIYELKATRLKVVAYGQNAKRRTLQERVILLSRQSLIYTVSIVLFYNKRALTNTA